MKHRLKLELGVEVLLGGGLIAILSFSSTREVVRLVVVNAVTAFAIHNATILALIISAKVLRWATEFVQEEGVGSFVAGCALLLSVVGAVASEGWIVLLRPLLP